MKNVFTYPNNPGTHYISPSYLGDSNSGLQRRIEDLLDGTYRAWTAPVPTASVTDFMADLSKFADYYADKEADGVGKVSLEAFYQHPLVKVSKKLIDSETVSAADIISDNTKVAITFTNAHEFEGGMQVRLASFDGTMAEHNNSVFFVDKVNSTTINLRAGASDGPYLRYTDLLGGTISSATAANPAVFTRTGHDLVDGTEVYISGFDGTIGTEDNNSYFYVQNKTANTFELSTDAAGTNILGYPNAVDQALDYIVLDLDGTVTITADSAVENLPNQSQIHFDTNDGTTHSALGAGQGLSKALLDYGNVHTSKISTDVYDLYTDYALTTKLDWDSDLNTALARQNIPVDIFRTGNTYTFRMTPTVAQTGGADLTDEKLFELVVAGSDTNAFEGLTASAEYYLSEETPSSGDYLLYNEAGKTTLADIGYNIINKAYNIYGESTDDRLFYPRTYDSTGAEITADTVAIYTDHYADISTFATIIGGTARYDNGKQFGLLAGTLGGKRLIQSTGNDFSVTGPVPGTLYSDEEIGKSVTGNLNDLQYRGGSPATPMHDALKTAYDADPNSVIGTPYVIEHRHGSAFTAAGQYYMIPVIYKSQRFQFLTFNINDDGTTGDMIEFGLQEGGDDYVRGYLQEAFTLDTSGGSTVTIPDADISFSGSSFGDSFTLTDNSVLKTGAKGHLNLYRTSDDALVETYENLVFLHQTGAGDEWLMLRHDNDGKLLEFDNTVEAAYGITLDTPSPIGDYYWELVTQNELVWNVGTTNYSYATQADNLRDFVEDKLQTSLTNGTFTANATGMRYNEVTTFDIIGLATTDSTTGLVAERHDTADAGDFANVILTDSTTGSVAVADPEEAFPYELDTATVVSAGHQVFKHLTGEDTYTFASEVDRTKYREAGFVSDTVISTSQENMPEFTVTVNGSGYLTGVTIDEEANAEGRFTNGNDICLYMQNPADTYTPTPLTTAEQQDVFDTDDEWTDTGYDPAKQWPDTVAPRRINWTHDMPSSVSMSMNGRKYVRGSGYQKLQMEVTYPPLTEAQFTEMSAVAQAMQGQVHPVLFELDMDNGKYLLNVNNYKPGNHYILEDASAGASIITVQGYGSGEQFSPTAGEMLIVNGTRNGNVVTAINEANSNYYGETKIRLSHPLNSSVTKGQLIYHKPAHIIVTLAEDGFIYSQRLDGFYDLTVTFEADEWKG